MLQFLDISCLFNATCNLSMGGKVKGVGSAGTFSAQEEENIAQQYLSHGISLVLGLRSMTVELCSATSCLCLSAGAVMQPVDLSPHPQGLILIYLNINSSAPPAE